MLHLRLRRLCAPWVVRIGSAALFVLVAFACKSSDSDQPDGNGSSSGFAGDGGPLGTSSSGNSSSGRTDGSTAPAQFVTLTDETMMFEGKTRQYILGKPKTYDAQKKYPLVMSFHGNPDTAKNQAASLPFDSASKNDAIIVYPLAADGENWDLETAATTTNTDANWMKPLVDEIATKASIDKTKVFGRGWSGGAFFLVQLTCKTGGVFKAISVIAGGSAYGFPTLASGCADCPGGPIASIVIRGTQDTVGDEYAAGCIAETNGCGGTASASTPVPCEAYDCAGKPPVKQCNIPNMGHQVWDQGMAESWKFFTSL